MIPLFIVGCERSGTTMLASILSGYYGVYAIPESQFLPKLPWGPDKKINGYFLNKILKNNFRYKVWNVKIKFVEDIDYDPPSMLLKLTKGYNQITYEKVNYIIDHTPSHIEKIIALKQLFPNCKFIHIIRDGRAIYSSINRLKDWSLKTPNGIAKHWQSRVGYGLAAEISCPNSILRVKYEDIIRNEKSILLNIMNFIGAKELRLRDHNIRFVLPPYTRHQHKLVGKPLHEQRIHDWKKNITDRELLIFESQAGEFLEHLGYPPITTKRKDITLFIEIKSLIIDVCYFLKSRLLTAIRLKRNVRS